MQRGLFDFRDAKQRLKDVEEKCSRQSHDLNVMAKERADLRRDNTAKEDSSKALAWSRTDLMGKGSGKERQRKCEEQNDGGKAKIEDHIFILGLLGSGRFTNPRNHDTVGSVLCVRRREAQKKKKRRGLRLFRVHTFSGNHKDTLRKVTFFSSPATEIANRSAGEGHGRDGPHHQTQF